MNNNINININTNSTRLPIGTKVQTDKLGSGTVTGYEEGDPPYSFNRYQVTLDNPELWVFSEHGCLPYFFEREISVAS